MGKSFGIPRYQHLRIPKKLLLHQLSLFEYGEHRNAKPCTDLIGGSPETDKKIRPESSLHERASIEGDAATSGMYPEQG